MIRFRALMVACVVTAPTALAQQVQQAATDQAGPTAFTVGPLQVIYQRRTTSQTVAVDLFLLGGSRQVTNRTAGIEPLILRAAGYGTKKYPGRSAAFALARTGSSISVDAENDWTIYSLHTVRSALDSAWSIFADRVAHPILSDADVNEESRVMLAERVVSSTDPDVLLQQVLRPIGFAGHPYAVDPAGSDIALRYLTPGAVRAYHDTSFVASRMVLSVVGDVDQATVERLVRSGLGDLPAGAYKWTLPPPLAVRKTSMTIIPRKLATDYIIGLFPGPAVNTREYGPFRLGTGLLGAYISYQVREKEQLSYAAFAPFYDNAVTAGGVYASTVRPEHVMEVMMESVENVANNGLPFALLPRFVSQFEIEGTLARETNSGQAEAMAKAFLLYGDAAAVDAPFKALHGASEGTLRSVSAHYMPAIQWVFVGDTSRFRRFMK